MSSTSVTARSPMSSTTTGILCVMAGIFCLTVSDALAKWLGAYYSPVQLLFMRALLALPLVVPFVLALGGRHALRSRYMGIHLTRGLLNVASASCFYLSLTLIPLAEATAIAFAAPLFVTALSVPLLKEPVGRTRWIATLAGFAGVLVIVRPGMAGFQPASLLPLATALIYALMMITARAIGKAESILTTMFCIVMGQLVCTSVLLPWFWNPLQLEHLPRLAALAVCSTLGLTLITQGFRVAPASVVASFDYSGLIWATLFGWLFWNEIPDTLAYVGAAIIVASGLYIGWRETGGTRRRKSGHARTQQQP